MKKIFVFSTISIALIITFLDTLKKEIDFPISKIYTVDKCLKGNKKILDFTYKSDGILKVANQSEQSLGISVLGQLSVSCIESGNEEIQEINLGSLSVSQNLNLDNEKIKEIEKGLTTPVFMYSTDYKSKLRSSSYLDSISSGIFLDIVESLFICPSSSNSWECEELHTNRNYLAKYLSTPTTIAKNFDYQDTTQTSYQGNIIFSLPLWNKVQYQKTQQQTQGDLSYIGTISINHSLGTFVTLTPQEMSQAKKRISNAKIAVNNQVRNSESIDYAKQLGNTAFSDLWSDKLPKNEMFLKILAWLNKYPNSNAAIKNNLLKEELDSSRKLWLQGFSKLGKLADQEMILETFHALNNDRDRRFALTALGFVLEPSSQSIEALKQIATQDPTSDIGKTALLNLGIMGNKPTGISAYQFLVDQLKTANNDNEIVTLLQALGNTKNDNLLDILRQYFSSQDPKIRASAIFASRFSPDSYLVLLDFLQSNIYSDALAASRSIKFLTLSIDQTIQILNLWKKIIFTQVRDQIINSIRSRGRKNLDLKIITSLQEVIDLESDEKIRTKLEDLAFSH